LALAASDIEPVEFCFFVEEKLYDLFPFPYMTFPFWGMQYKEDVNYGRRYSFRNGFH